VAATIVGGNPGQATPLRGHWIDHELRTLLTILRSQVEGLRVGMLAPGPEPLGSLEEEVGRMTRLVADLQVLSAADALGFPRPRRHRA
jgi:signal transduction histidine kinase